MPTAPSVIFTNNGLTPWQNPEEARTIQVKFPNATGAVAKGTVIGQLTGVGTNWGAYNDGVATGLEVARAILQYDVYVDANGVHTITGAGSTQGEKGEKAEGCPAFVAGTFATAELVGLNAAGVTDLGRLIQGTLADGILRMG